MKLSQYWKNMVTYKTKGSVERLALFLCESEGKVWEH